MSERSDKPLTMVPGPTTDASKRMVFPERRAHFRFPFTAAAGIFDVLSQARIVGRCSDLSATGCYIDTLSPFAVGATVRIRLERELVEFEAMAKVSYSLISMGMGLQFTAIKPEHQAVLQTWIAELSGEEKAAPEVGGTGPEGGMLAAVVNLRQVLNELINLMVRKKIISENEGAGLLRQMFR